MTKMALFSKRECKLTEYAAEIVIYFEKHKLIEIAKKILIECAVLRPVNPNKWIAKNIRRIANEIYHDCLNQGRMGIVKSLHLSTKFLYRIVMFGRPGSGRKTQSKKLAAKFNLVLIDAELLTYQHLKGVDEQPYDTLDRKLQNAFIYDNCYAKSKALLDIIGRRVLQNDCLRRGWVLLNYTHTLQDFKNILENFKVPPNKLVYLKCSERNCMQRVLNIPGLVKSSRSYTYYEEEMRFFNRHENEIVDYFLNRYETISIDASQSSDAVKNQLMNSIIRSPYVMGFKK